MMKRGDVKALWSVLSESLSPHIFISHLAFTCPQTFYLRVCGRAKSCRLTAGRIVETGCISLYVCLHRTQRTETLL